MWPLPLFVAEQQIGPMRSPRPHCFCEAAFKHGMKRCWISMRTYQTDSKTFVKIQIQRNRNRVSATLASNIASDSQMQQKLRLKRIKYISIRRGKSLPQWLAVKTTQPSWIEILQPSWWCFSWAASDWLFCTSASCLIRLSLSASNPTLLRCRFF